MDKVFKFKEREIDVSFDIQMDVELMATDRDFIFIEFSSDSDDLKIEHDKNTLHIKDKNNADFRDVNVDSISDLLSLVFKKGMQTSYSDRSGCAKIYIPDYNVSMSIRANNIKLKSSTDIKELNMKFNICKAKINSRIDSCSLKTNVGNVVFKKSIGRCKIKGNNLDIDTKSGIKDLDMKLNNGSATLYVDSFTSSWEIKSNNAAITLGKDNVDITQNGKSTYKVGNGIIRVKTNGNINIQ